MICIANFVTFTEEDFSKGFCCRKIFCYYSCSSSGVLHMEYQDTAQNMKFSIKDFFSKCDQIRSFLRIWSHLLKKSLMENFIFCAVERPF